jgi:hypothetical protein
VRLVASSDSLTLTRACLIYSSVEIFWRGQGHAQINLPITPFLNESIGLNIAAFTD